MQNTIGKPCQRWEAQKPDVHIVLAGYIPDEIPEDAVYFVTLVVMANAMVLYNNRHQTGVLLYTRHCLS